MLQNRVKPSGAIVVKSEKDGSGGNLNQKQHQRLKGQINDHYSGPVNTGRPIVLEERPRLARNEPITDGYEFY